MEDAENYGRAWQMSLSKAERRLPRVVQVARSDVYRDFFGQLDPPLFEVDESRVRGGSPADFDPARLPDVGFLFVRGVLDVGSDLSVPWRRVPTEGHEVEIRPVLYLADGYASSYWKNLGQSQEVRDLFSRVLAQFQASLSEPERWEKEEVVVHQDDCDAGRTVTVHRLHPENPSALAS